MRVLITGAVSGLGAALGEVYAERGGRVLLTGLEPDRPMGLPRGDVSYLRLDVRDSGQWEGARDWVERRWGGIDLLVNNAGVAAGGRIDVVPAQEWERVIATNLMGVVHGCRTFVPLMKAQRSGRIVNVASMAGLVHPPSMSVYSVGKAGVVALSESLLHELAPYGVHVSVVCPSFFRSGLQQSIQRSDPDAARTAHRLITGARLDAATVAARTVRALDRGEYLVLPHVHGRAVYALKRLMAPVYHRSMKRLAHRLATAPAAAIPDRPPPRGQGCVASSR